MQATLFSIGFLLRYDAAFVFAATHMVTIFLGNISAFVVFWVAFAADFARWQVLALFAIIFAGEVTGDCLWYVLGRGLRDTRFGMWIKNHIPRHERAEAAIQKKGKKYLYLSKFAYGSAGFVIFFLGWMRMDFRTFIKNSLISVILVLPIVFFMAYGLFSGLAPLTAVAAFKSIGRVFLIGIVAFIVLEWLLGKAVKALLGNGDGDGERSEK